MLNAMRFATLSRNVLALAALCASLPALADTRIQIRRMTRDDVPLGKGQCDIRLQVDNEVEVAVRRDLLTVRTISGRDARDDGSECNAPMPDRDLEGFNCEVKESRNDIRLLAEPSRRNDFTAIVRIRDSSGGEGRYHFRLTWQMTGTVYGRGNGPSRRDDDERPRGGPGFSWNNTISFRGNGRGIASWNTRGEPQGELRLSDVTVEIDRGGKIVAYFRADRGRSLTFTGQLMGSEGPGRIKADVTSEDRRLHGPMYLSVDDRRQVNSITLEATDGRDRMQLSWDRR